MENEQLLSYSYYPPSFSPPDPLLLLHPPPPDHSPQYWSSTSPPFLPPPSPPHPLHCPLPSHITPHFSSHHVFPTSSLPPHTQFHPPFSSIPRSIDSSSMKQDWLSSLSQGVPLSSFPTLVETNKPADCMRNCEPAPDVAIDAHHELKLQAANWPVGGTNAHSVALRLSDVMAALRGAGADPDPPHSNSDRIPPEELGCPRLIKPELRQGERSNPKKSRKVWESESASSKLVDKASALLQGEVMQETRKVHGFGWIADVGRKRDVHIYAERERRRGMSHAYATLRSLLPKEKVKADRCSVLTEAMQYIQELLEKLDELGKQKAEMLAEAKKAGVQENHNTEVATTITTLKESTKESACGSSNYNEGDSKHERDEVENGDEKVDAYACDEDEILVNDEGEVGVRLLGEDAFITVVCTFKKRGCWSGLLEVLQQLGFYIHNVTFSASPHSTHHCIHAKVPRGFEMTSSALQRSLGEFVSGARKSNSCAIQNMPTLSSH